MPIVGSFAKINNVREPVRAEVFIQFTSYLIVAHAEKDGLGVFLSRFRCQFFSNPLLLPW